MINMLRRVYMYDRRSGVQGVTPSLDTPLQEGVWSVFGVLEGKIVVQDDFLVTGGNGDKKEPANNGVDEESIKKLETHVRSVVDHLRKMIK